MSWRNRWRLPERIPFRLRVFFRGAFLLLSLATLALALSVLQEEKQLSWQNYQDGFRKNQAQILARLRHPTGQLALLNPNVRNGSVTPLRPLVLPFSAIDFDDKAKAQQAVEMAGCLVQYRDASLCVAVGNNPRAGGFIYTVGTFASGDLVGRVPGSSDMSVAHRVRITVRMRGHTFRWLAPFEGEGQRGRLPGFVLDEQGVAARRPVRDFRGWLWQDGRCMDADRADADACLKRTFFSVRLPIELFQDELFTQQRPVWPPVDLDQIQVRVEWLPPGDGPALFDSNNESATPPFALADLTGLLLPGETLRIRKPGASIGQDLVMLKGVEDASQTSSPWLNRLIRQLPVDGFDQPIEAVESIQTPLGRYELVLTGDLRGVNRGLGVVATRVSWFVGGMLIAILVTWMAIELRMIRRITVLTKRAAAVSRSVKGGDGLVTLDVGDLRSGDELGLLAGVLADLMQRVNDDVRREHIRAAQEKDQWHAVGHEIMSPLQSLMVLHGGPDDPSHRYIVRMQQAVRVLYGSASPSEAFQSATLQVQALDVRAFLQHVASNAPDAGIDQVLFSGPAGPLMARADEYSLEDVVTHVLRNADRHRLVGTPITMTLIEQDLDCEVRLHNQGDPIAEDMIERIFEYGVSDQPDSGAQGHRGQGLFVARTYMAKMGGTIRAVNEHEGVSFVLRLPKAQPDPRDARKST